MDDLISRQAAIDALGERPLVWTGDDYELGCANQYDSDKLAIETVPSVQERKGHWIKLYDGNYKCSECGAWWHSDDMDINEEFRYCPNCGAKMEGAES